MPIDRSNVRGLVRAIAYDLRGARLGRVAQVFLDDRSDEPAWVAVDVTRVRGMRLLPLSGAAMKGRHLVIRAERSTVRSAPRIDLGDGQLSSQDESRLLEHYGLAPAAGDDSSGGDHRPASPWPDDTERETAWERPTHPQVHPNTQPIGQAWQQSSAADGGIGDRVPTRHFARPESEPAGSQPPSSESPSSQSTTSQSTTSQSTTSQPAGTQAAEGSAQSAPSQTGTTASDSRAARPSAPQPEAGSAAR